MTAVVFSAATLEAFINFFGVAYNLPGLKKLDRLSIRGKYEKYPEIAGGELGAEIVGHVVRIATLRNGIVHNRPTLATDEDGFPSLPFPEFWPHHASRVIQLVNLVVERTADSVPDGPQRLGTEFLWRDLEERFGFQEFRDWPDGARVLT